LLEGDVLADDLLDPRALPDELDVLLADPHDAPPARPGSPLEVTAGV
jgi:hypothetical protein